MNYRSRYASLFVGFCVVAGGAVACGDPEDAGDDESLARSDSAVSGTTNLALNKAVTVSSVERSTLPASAAVDGNPSSRWGSLWSDAQWITVDLGAATSINHVVLDWENAYARSFKIQTSTDGATWSTVFSTTAGGGGTEDVKFTAIKARYVKMLGIARATPYGYSLYEFQVFGDGGSTSGSTTRDPLKQPFASSSIWNMPIGTGAVYVPANLKPVPGSGTVWGFPFPDQDQIVLKPTSPLVNVRYSSVGWNGGDRCAASSSTVLATVPMPANFLVPNGGDNNSSAFLAADGHTLVQVQPLARCTNGGIATSLMRAPDVDLYGDGILGAHGGSGLSSIGGTLRLGELRPGQTGPRHAIKLTLYMKEAYRCTTAQSCFRWPAVAADGYAVGFYGTGANNPNVANAALKMGALLALPASLDLASLNLESEPAKQLAWTLKNYGAYVVDDTYGQDFGVATENGPDGSFVAQFKSDYGFDFHQASTANLGWPRDLMKILPHIQVVNNNGPTTIGGGGTPLQPLAPAIAP